MNTVSTCRNAAAIATGALMLTAGLALAMPSQAHAAGAIKSGEELATRINNTGGEAVYDSNSCTVKLMKDYKTNSAISFTSITTPTSPST